VHASVCARDRGGCTLDSAAGAAGEREGLMDTDARSAGAARGTLNSARVTSDARRGAWVEWRMQASPGVVQLNPGVSAPYCGVVALEREAALRVAPLP